MVDMYVIVLSVVVVDVNKRGRTKCEQPYN
jgi:hypothetical protein